jgi:DNA-binding transcriptional regulator YhcF (GntR family)
MLKNYIDIDTGSAVPKYRQIMENILEAIKEKKILKGDKLPSISQLCLYNNLGRDTIMFAFNELKSRGIISGVQGKGYYIINDQVDLLDRYFLLFDELNAYTAGVYNALIASLPKTAIADIFFHLNNYNRLDSIIAECRGKYTSFIIACNELINPDDPLFRQLPKQNLIFISPSGNGFLAGNGIYHNYEQDIFDAFKSLKRRLKKYCRLVYISDDNKNGLTRVAGFIRFCKEEQIKHSVCYGLSGFRPALYEAYVLDNDELLVEFVRQIDEKNHFVGNNIGIVSINDNRIKEALYGGLTTISVNYLEMGNLLVDLANGRRRGHIRLKPTVNLRISL